MTIDETIVTDAQRALVASLLPAVEPEDFYVYRVEGPGGWHEDEFYVTVFAVRDYDRWPRSTFMCLTCGRAAYSRVTYSSGERASMGHFANTSGHGRVDHIKGLLIDRDLWNEADEPFLHMLEGAL